VATAVWKAYRSLSVQERRRFGRRWLASWGVTMRSPHAAPVFCRNITEFEAQVVARVVGARLAFAVPLCQSRPAGALRSPGVRGPLARAEPNFSGWACKHVSSMAIGLSFASYLVARDNAGFHDSLMGVGWLRQAVGVAQTAQAENPT
jgi:hypothetical protein